MTTNRIISRGLGASRGASGRAGLITMGYGGIPPIVIQEIQKKTANIKGQSDKIIEELKLITIWAQLIEVNERPPVTNVSGSVTIKYSNNQPIIVEAKKILSSVNFAFNTLKVTIRRVFRNS